MEPEHAPLKDDRGNRLIADAAKVFLTFGIKSVTMDDLATRLGISKKTLYQYVKDKNDLVEKVLAQVTEQFTCAIDEVVGAGKNAIDTQYDIMVQVGTRTKGFHSSIHFDLEKYHPEAFRRMTEYRRGRIYSNAVANMEKGIREGLYREDLNIPMIASMYTARFTMILGGDEFPRDRFSIPQLHWEAFRYHIRGIASAKGLKYLIKKEEKAVLEGRTTPNTPTQEP